MQVLPVPIIPSLQSRFLSQNPPAGLVILAKPNRILPPAGSEGVALPPDRILPYSGIYDENGKLPKIPGPGSTFLAKV